MDDEMENGEINLRSIINDQKGQIVFLQEQLKLANDQIAMLSQQNVDISRKLDTLLAVNKNKDQLSDGNHNHTLKNKRVADEMGENPNAKAMKSNNITMDDSEIGNGSSAGMPNYDTWADLVNPVNVSTTNSTNTTTGGKPTPIQLGIYDRKTTSNIHENLVKYFNGVFAWKQLSPKYPARIYTNDEINKQKIIECLKAGHIEFSSFSNKNDRHRAYIVRGLPEGDDNIIIGKIANALNEHGIIGDCQIKRHITGNMKRNPENAASLYAIIVGANTNDKNIGNIKQIGSFKVNIEKMKKSGVVQCRKCQRFNHTANQCNFEYRCVQCTKKHPPGACPRKSNSNLPIDCVNCLAAGFTQHSGHTANNLMMCQFFKKNHSAKLETSGAGPNQKVTGNIPGKQNSTNGASANEVNVNASTSGVNYNRLHENVNANPAKKFAHRQRLRLKKKINNDNAAKLSGESIQSNGGASMTKNKNKSKISGDIAGLLRSLVELIGKFQQ